MNFASTKIHNFDININNNDSDKEEKRKQCIEQNSMFQINQSNWLPIIWWCSGTVSIVRVLNWIDSFVWLLFECVFFFFFFFLFTIFDDSFVYDEYLLGLHLFKWFLSFIHSCCLILIHEIRSILYSRCHK